MITNTGKQIIAKYLLGTTTSYAAYIALGCGAKPKLTTSSASGTSSSSNVVTVPSMDAFWKGAKISLVSKETIVISNNGTVGSISGSGPWTATITGMSTTVGLSIGDKITATAGTGSLGGSGLYIVATIPSTTSITFTATGGTTPTAGTITNIKYGTGELSSTEDTIITEITSSTTFTVDPAPVVDLYNAVISAEINPSLQVLDFEMFRVPITSRGYINDSGVNKVVLTAELPTEERYEISEVSVYSAGANSSAGPYDSKTITAFADTESWTYNNGSGPNSAVIPTSTDPVNPNPIYALMVDIPLADEATNNITVTSKAIQTLSTNFTFENTDRAERYERCRYLNNIIMLRGNSSHIGLDSSNNFVFGGTPTFFNLSGQTVDFSRNSTSDLLKIAFSVVNVNGDDNANIAEKIRVMVEFSDSNATQYARMQCDITGSTILNNRYVVVEKRLDELVYSPTFSWNAVSEIKIYASAIDNETTISNKALTSNIATISTGSTPHGLTTGDGVTIYGVDSTFNGTYTVLDAPTSTSFRYNKTAPNVTSAGTTGNFDKVNSNYFIALDAIRLDNVSTINPLYGMIGYALVETPGAVTIVKQTNTSNYIEFRFVLDVS